MAAQYSSAGRCIAAPPEENETLLDYITFDSDRPTDSLETLKL